MQIPEEVTATFINTNYWLTPPYWYDLWCDNGNFKKWFKNIILCKCILTHVASPPTISTEAARMSTWRKTFFWAIHHVHALRPSSTCERWARASACPPESTWSSPPPLSPTKRLTLSSGSSPRSSRRQSTCPLCVWFFYCPFFTCKAKKKNVNSPADIFCVAEKWTTRSLLI